MTTQTLPKDSGSSLFPLVLSIVAAAATGVLWAYANPIQLVPGVIQWRIFAFLPPLIGILLGWKSGFICGYLGTIVWSLLAGTFIPAHSLIVDGIMVGLTGLVPGLLFNPATTTFDKSALVRIALVCLVVGLVMVAAVSVWPKALMNLTSGNFSMASRITDSGIAAAPYVITSRLERSNSENFGWSIRVLSMVGTIIALFTFSL